ncbi:MAG: hypothetical protein M3N95_06345 [Actinomycetota bacterium]|nr:hypothetical protein [Actinomycetota bacterium]
MLDLAEGGILLGVQRQVAVDGAGVLERGEGVGVGIAEQCHDLATADPHGAGLWDEIAQLSPTGDLTATLTPAGQLRGRALVVHPGETVQFRVAPSAVEWEHRDGARQGQVTLDSTNLPGGGSSVHLNSDSAYRVTFTKPGVYSFHWQVGAVDQSRTGPEPLSELVRVLGRGVDSVQRWTGLVIVGAGTATERAALEARTDAATTPTGQPSDVAAPPQRPTSTATGVLVGAGKSAGAPRPASSGVSPLAEGPEPSVNALPPASPPRTAPHAAAVPMTPVADYVVSGLFGFLILGILWMIWIASIRPILGR